MKKKILIIAAGIFLLLPTTAAAQERTDLQVQLLSLLRDVVELQEKLAMEISVNPVGTVAGVSTSLSPVEIHVEVSGTPQPGYFIVADASWDSLSDAVSYEVTTDARDSIYTATTVQKTESTSLMVGRFYNRDAPNDCYRISTVVEAFDSSGNVIGKGSGSICEIGEPPVTTSEGITQAAHALGALESALKALRELVE